MKTFIKILLMSIPVLLFGCDKDDENGTIGKINDYDATKCACCGGYLIEIGDENYIFSDDDVAGNNPLNAIDIQFPLYVRLKWSVKPGDCADRIVVQELRLTTKR